MIITKPWFVKKHCDILKIGYMLESYVALKFSEINKWHTTKDTTIRRNNENMIAKQFCRKQ